MVIGRGGPTIMRRFSASPLAGVETPIKHTLDATLGKNAAMYATWSERHGDMEMSVSELWIQMRPDIWVATSLKK